MPGSVKDDAALEAATKSGDAGSDIVETPRSQSVPPKGRSSSNWLRRNRISGKQIGFPPRTSRRECLTREGCSDDTDDGTLSRHSCSEPSDTEASDEDKNGSFILTTRWADMTEEDLALQAAGLSPGLPTPTWSPSPASKSDNIGPCLAGDPPKDSNATIVYQKKSHWDVVLPRSHPKFRNPCPLSRELCPPQAGLSATASTQNDNWDRPWGQKSVAHRHKPFKPSRVGSRGTTRGRTRGWFDNRANYDWRQSRPHHGPAVIHEQTPSLAPMQRQNTALPQAPWEYKSPLRLRDSPGPSAQLRDNVAGSRRPRWGFKATGLAVSRDFCRATSRTSPWEESKEHQPHQSPRLTPGTTKRPSEQISHVEGTDNADSTISTASSRTNCSTLATSHTDDLAELKRKNEASDFQSESASPKDHIVRSDNHLAQPKRSSSDTDVESQPVRFGSRIESTIRQGLSVVIGSVLVRSTTVNKGLRVSATDKESPRGHSEPDKGPQLCVDRPCHTSISAATLTPNDPHDVGTISLYPPVKPKVPVMIPLPPGFVVDIHQFVYDLRGFVPVLIGPWQMPSVQSLLQSALLQCANQLYASFNSTENHAGNLASPPTYQASDKSAHKAASQIPKSAARAAAFTPTASVSPKSSMLTEEKQTPGADNRYTAVEQEAQNWFSPLVTPYPMKLSCDELARPLQRSDENMAFRDVRATSNGQTGVHNGHDSYKFGYPAKSPQSAKTSRPTLRITKRRVQASSLESSKREVSPGSSEAQLRLGHGPLSLQGSFRTPKAVSTGPLPAGIDRRSGTAAPSSSCRDLDGSGQRRDMNQFYPQPPHAVDTFGQPVFLPLSPCAHFPSMMPWMPFAGGPARPEHAGLASASPHWGTGPPSFAFPAHPDSYLHPDSQSLLRNEHEAQQQLQHFIKPSQLELNLPLPTLSSPPFQGSLRLTS